MFGFGRKKSLSAVCVTASDRGLVRKDNQDSAFVDQAKTFFCVADGMGGGSEGATASRFVCEELSRVAEAENLVGRMEAVNMMIRAANDRIRAYAKERNFAQMGSTVAVLLVDPKNFRRGAVCHVGDTRIYRVRRGCAELLTRDHTIGGQLSEFACGQRAADLRSRSNPLAHVLTRVVGVEEKVSGEWRKIDIEEGDAFLVCSDGVHDVVADSVIGEILSLSPDLDAASKRLQEEVVRNGAPDNYTYVIVEIRDAR